jgi:hypothetical protein
MNSKLPRYLWLKYNESYGFVGVTAGQSLTDVDKDVDAAAVDVIVGYGAMDMIQAYKARSLEMPIEASLFLQARGWFEDDALYFCSGDVAAYGFSRM